MTNSTAFNLTPLDHELLAMKDEDFVPHDWNNLRDIIRRNDLGALMRKPSDLRRYLSWSAETKAEYGTMMNYICIHRLKWPLPSELTGTVPAPDIHSSDTVQVNGSSPDPQSQSKPSGPLLTFKNPQPFADPEDYKILRNDWPYGFEPGISHLVVWSRTPIPVASDEGHLTAESRALINGFVQRQFVQRLAEDKAGRFLDPESHVLWFKNWVGLQSVRALEHVHVLVRNVPEDILAEWSGESR
ncbi:uncharacterized protein N7483_008644 [Penicillium malachiteum]|uniref:uncharacterized protein n=1 Tax=Penicillium malachiteum TaxID=1324776 RepID=UPI0025473657|nr:uncharacterized protein N7483_008644 [Penicillium malachiteum]KAJ5720710.1 hypothetical protein N7483_008644 [Penicillium malachiteum]